MKPFLVAILFLITLSALAGEKKFPFTEEENRDGARFVWFVYQQAGLPYEFVTSEKFPSSPRFLPSPEGKPQEGDVAWWKQYVAIYSGPTKKGEAPPCTELLTAERVVCLSVLEDKLGKVKWYRYDVPE